MTELDRVRARDVAPGWDDAAAWPESPGEEPRPGVRPRRIGVPIGADDDAPWPEPDDSHAPAGATRPKATKGPQYSKVWERRHIIAAPLSPTARLVAILILECRGLQLGACTMSDESLADELRATVRTVQRALAELRRIGWLRTQRRRNDTALRWIVLPAGQGSQEPPPMADPNPVRNRHPMRILDESGTAIAVADKRASVVGARCARSPGA